MERPIRRIAINTGGGDAPGLNAVIRSIVLAGLRRGWEVIGIHKGYEGLLDTSKIVQLSRESVRGITHLGGHGMFLSPGDTQLGRGEPIEDSARVISSMVDIVMTLK